MMLGSFFFAAVVLWVLSVNAEGAETNLGSVETENRRIRGPPIATQDNENLTPRFMQDPDADFTSMKNPRVSLGRDFRPRQASCPECSDDFVGQEVTDFREDIFNQLSVSEFQSLVNFVTANGLAEGTLNVVSTPSKALNSNYIVFLQLFDPPKLEAIDYLDGLTSTPPERFGIVTVHRGASRPRDVMQYKIGPLRDGRVDESGSVVVEQLLGDNEIPWSMRGQYGGAEGQLYGNIINHASKMQDVFRATTGGYCIGDSSCDYASNIMYHTSGNINTNSTHRITNVNFFLAPNGENFGTAFLMPIPISFQLVEDPDRDPSEWDTINYDYCYQGPFNSAVQLNTQFLDGRLRTCTIPNSNFEWTLTDPVEPIREDSRIKEPISFHSSGKRYNIASSTSGRRALQDERDIDEIDAFSTEASRASVEGWHISNHLRDRFKEARRNALVEEARRNQKDRNLQVADSDGTGHKVSWMGWTFHVSSDQMHGMVIKNLKFKGERLAYEMSFQEYFASYSSSGSSAGIFYFDSNWEIGALSPLVLGVDCPEDATLLPLVQFYGRDAWVSSNLLCIFEQPYGEPLWRHGFDHSNIGGIPRTALKVRVVSTMGNYDYIPTLSLMADGVLELKLEMGGYLQAGYETDVGMPDMEAPFLGTQLRDNAVGLLHDHVIGVKADLDVGGLQNSLLAGKVTHGSFEQATGRSPSGLSQNDFRHGVKYMNWTLIDSETGISAKDYNAIVITSTSRNSWNVKRSYELVFHSTISSQVYPPDHPVGQTTGWQYQNVAITRQKDAERRCSFPSNFNVGTPIPSFDLRSFQQGGDSVIDEDLVFWLMFGAEHYPKAEDVPLVSNFGSGFLLKPRNFFHRAAFEDLSDNRNEKHSACVPKAS